MIRFLIGCLLAIAVFWAALFTIGIFVLPQLEHAAAHKVPRR